MLIFIQKTTQITDTSPTPEENYGIPPVLNSFITGGMLGAGSTIPSFGKNDQLLKEQILKNKYSQNTWDKFQAENNMHETATKINTVVTDLEGNFKVLKGSVAGKLEELNVALRTFLRRFNTRVALKKKSKLMMVRNLMARKLGPQKKKNN